MPGWFDNVDNTESGVRSLVFDFTDFVGRVGFGEASNAGTGAASNDGAAPGLLLTAASTTCI
jgi:hypothetical protein